MSLEYVKRNFEELSGEIAELAEKYSDGGVTLVSVTKSGSDEEVLELVRSGAADIGENRPQMLVSRGDMLAGLGFFPTLHEIGSLQRNKVKLVVGRAGLIHSLDSERLAEAISREALSRGIKMPVLIEINSGREEAKGGIFPENAEAALIAFKKYEGLMISGIMTMGPVTETPEEIRPYFRETKKIFDDLNSRYGFDFGGILSMGMSDSYKIAIEEGSTLVRVGRRLFIK